MTGLLGRIFTVIGISGNQGIDEAQAGRAQATGKDQFAIKVESN